MFLNQTIVGATHFNIMNQKINAKNVFFFAIEKNKLHIFQNGCQQQKMHIAKH